jgi:phage gp46-like protein
MQYVDLLLEEKNNYYDIIVTTKGDFETTAGLGTAILVSLYTDGRADGSRIAIPDMRRGWWGNLFSNVVGSVQIGSLIWLLDQTSNTQEALNFLIDQCNLCLNWIITNNYASTINITGISTLNQLGVLISFSYPNNTMREYILNIWNNTILEVKN